MSDGGRTLRLLVLDDSPSDVEITVETLVDAGFDVELRNADSEETFRTALATGDFDIILLDYTVPGYDTLEALKLALEMAPDTPCIGVSGTIGEEAAVEMIQCGARDYVLKDRLKRLPIVITRTLEAGEERRARAEAESALERNRDLFRAVIDATPDSVYVRDLEGRHLMVNKGALARMGKTEDEVLGRTVVDILGGGAGDLTHQDREAIEGRRTITREQEVTGVPGGPRTVLVTNGPLFDEAGNVYGVYGFSRDISDRKRIENELANTNERLEKMVHQIASVMGRVVEARDPYTQGHEVGVARISKLLATELGLAPDDIDGIELAALVHDIGKLSVPAEILTKPGALSDVEFAIVRYHPESGHTILSEIDFAWPIADIVLQHHERMDGTGYPSGLTGDQILLAARVIAVADVVEAMSAHRPYRPGLGLDAAMAELRAHPERYDTSVVAAAVRLYERGDLAV